MKIDTLTTINVLLRDCSCTSSLFIVFLALSSNVFAAQSGGDPVAGVIGVIVFLVIVIFCFAIYFIPSIVAIASNHSSAGGIVALNLLLGWSFIGWVVALVWALSAPRTVVQHVVQNVPVKVCPQCKMQQSLAARFCSNCGFSG